MASRKSNETEEDEARTNTAADEVAHEATAHSTVAVADSEVMEDIADEAGVVVMGPPEEVAAQMNPNI